MAYDWTMGEWRLRQGSESGTDSTRYTRRISDGRCTHVVLYELGLRTLVTEE